MNFNYSLKWIIQRVSALLLIPLSFWFIYNCIKFQNLTYPELNFFFKSYLNSSLFLLMMITMIIHAKLGCETIVQDYFSNLKFRKYFINFINFIAIFSLFFSILAIIKLNISL